MPGGMTGGFS